MGDVHLRCRVVALMVVCLLPVGSPWADVGGVVEALAVVWREVLSDTTIRVEMQQSVRSLRCRSVSNLAVLRKFLPNCMGITFH